MKSLLLITTAALCLCFSPLSLTRSANMTPSTSDWPQWRGPERNGLSPESGLLKQWPAEGPKLVWQVNDIGDGYSTPAVVGTRIYLMGNRAWRTSLFKLISSGWKIYLDHTCRQRRQPEAGSELPEGPVHSHC